MNPIELILSCVIQDMMVNSPLRYLNPVHDRKFNFFYSLYQERLVYISLPLTFHFLFSP